MKAYLQFNLPEEQENFNDALDGTKLRNFIQAYDNKLRGFIKHTYEMGSYDAARDLLYETAGEYDIDIWE
jgi:hypothetical protein